MAYTMKGAPMKRNFGIDAKNGPTMYNTKKSGAPKNELTAMEKASLAAAVNKKPVEVSGGKKTVQGSFVQHPGTTKQGGGSSTAGNSVEHAALRVKAKNRTISASEKARLAELEAATEKAYKART